MADYRFTIDLDSFDTSLLPSGSPLKGTKDFATAVHRFLQEQFAGFKGDARIVVSEDTITVEWTPPSSAKDPIQAAVAKLENGEIIPAITLLELLRQRHPRDFRLLYNLGLAYSNLDRVEEARNILGMAVEIDPDFVDARIALAVTYAKEHRYPEAVAILNKAVADDPDNPWGQRNLGGCLLAMGEVERGTACLLRATELSPRDQQAFYGLGEAYRAAEKYKEADDAYKAVIAIDEYSEFAKQAQEALSALAQLGYRQRGGTTGRSDAVMYCLSALEDFDKRSLDEVQRITFEIGMLGMKGFEVNNPEKKYELRSLPGKFTGLNMVCIMYVGFKIIAPDHPPSFDLAAEYEVAKTMFEKRKGKG
jgi:Flp pilus assembly protein TadD